MFLGLVNVWLRGMKKGLAKIMFQCIWNIVGTLNSVSFKFQINVDMKQKSLLHDLDHRSSPYSELPLKLKK